MSSIQEVRQQVVSEIDNVLVGIENDAFEQFCAHLAGARRVVCFGLGREGLALRGFCMRLMHLGRDAHMAGDVTAKPVGPGDVLLVTSGPGNLALTRSMIELGHEAGATVIVVTAQPDGPDAHAADFAITIPAQTMATDVGSASALAMGTAFELAMAIYFDIAVIRIQELTGQTLGDMRERHFNLE